ncbi:hypothetical protein Q428_12230 [Fervidicella metallireducens AeB]|uniref:Glycosyl transferase n=1 Tax=Fervidicella metallireducens AeB TaxID=1403537 RepID=A0A017RT64_9CLOT|nr:glycosyltransferase [Fervidicella metallireducens]EYE87634.1 hypothetical protein Q428_12230 [Fervidicella metallireducens AeB]
MNVLHLISGGEAGGSRKHLLLLAENMQKTGVKTIVACFIEGKLYYEAKELGIDIRLIKQEKRFDLSVVERLKKLCHEEKIDVVNCHGGRANFLGYFLMKKYKSAKYITTLHSDYREDYKGNKYKTLVYSNINKFVLKHFDGYVNVSEALSELLLKRGFKKEKVFLINNGIDFNAERVNPRREDVIEKYNLKKAGHYVSIVARMHKVKGHRVFLDACTEVLKSFKDVVFILVGDGVLMDEMISYSKEKGIYENTAFVGFKNPAEFFAISDFTVLSSYTEGFPITLLESAMYHKTMVSTEVGGIPKLIEDGYNGYLVPVGDSLKMAEKILDLLEDENKAVIFGERLNEKARKEYSIESFVDGYLKIYNTVLSGGK